MSHSVQVTLIADQYITLIGHEVNVHDLTVIHLDDSGVVCGYSTDEHTKLRSPAPAATVTGWRLLERDEIIQEGDEYQNSIGVWADCKMSIGKPKVDGLVRRRLSQPAPPSHVAGNSITDKVIELASQHANTWTDKDVNFWYRGLVEEMYELSLAIDGQHEHTPEYELLQISAIAINFIRHLSRLAALDGQAGGVVK